MSDNNTLQRLQPYMPKSILETMFHQGVFELLRHLQVHCPNCEEGHNLFTTSGVLEPIAGAKTGRCSTCNTDFYYVKAKAWFESFTPKVEEGGKDE